MERKTMTIATTDFTTEAEAIKDATDWRTAASALIEFWTALDRCYSSGEIAACLRTHRMDLRFSVTSLGEFVRDNFYQGALPSYDDGSGNDLQPVQVSRYTVGDGRTPPGVLVFCYGPDQITCESHGFEVDIPRGGSPNGVHTDGPQTPAPVVVPAPKGSPRPVPSNLPMAYVGKDTRCYVARKVVDAYLGAADVVLRQGDEMHVTQANGVAKITATAQPGSQPYNIWKGSGRVAFYAPNGTPFVEGTKYPVDVSPNGITVDLQSPG